MTHKHTAGMELLQLFHLEENKALGVGGKRTFYELDTGIQLTLDKMRCVTMSPSRKR